MVAALVVESGTTPVAASGPATLARRRGEPLERQRPIRTGREAFEALLYGTENWDGSGYPEGLAASAIPRVARAYAVCRDLPAGGPRHQRRRAAARRPPAASSTRAWCSAFSHPAAKAAAAGASRRPPEPALPGLPAAAGARARYEPAIRPAGFCAPLRDPDCARTEPRHAHAPFVRYWAHGQTSNRSGRPKRPARDACGVAALIGVVVAALVVAHHRAGRLLRLLPRLAVVRRGRLPHGLLEGRSGRDSSS